MDIKIACGQIEVKPAQPGENTKAILAMIDKAKQAKADILLLPEMAIPGYLLGDLWEQEAFLKDCAAYGEEVVAASQGLVVIFGNIAIDPTRYNQDGHMLITIGGNRPLSFIGSESPLPSLTLPVARFNTSSV